MPRRPEGEQIPVIVPTLTPASVEHSNGGAGDKDRGRTHLVTFVTIGLGAILLSLAVGVFIFLPGMVDRPEVVPPATEPVRGKDTNVDQHSSSAAEGSNEAAERGQARRDAEQVVGKLLRSQAALEAQGVGVWGAEDYALALAKADSGNDYFASGAFVEALTHYNEALALLEDLKVTKAARLSAALEAGERALASGDGAKARSQFARALAIDATNVRAQQGAERAKNVEKMTRLLSEAHQHEQDGELGQALAGYREAAMLDPQSLAARTGLERVASTLAGKRFRANMSAALSAIERQDFAGARRALEKARVIDPASVAVADAEARLNESEQRHQIAAHRTRAQQFERAEKWAEAASEYAAILAIDSDIQFAISGEATSRDLARLHAQLDRYLQEPSRLHSARPLRAAEQLLRSTGTTVPHGPHLQRKLDSLARLVIAAKSPVPVVLLSDGLTEVMLYRVGELGSFSRRELSLRPGIYTVTGKRAGYRDVRYEFTVSGGRSLDPIVVRCEERI